LPFLAEWHLNSGNPLVGLRLLDQAVELDPDDAVVQARRSDALQSVGRMNAAVDSAHRAIEINPLWSFARAKYISALSYAGHFSRAKADIADAHRKWPLNLEIDAADFGFQYRYGDPRVAEELMSRVLNYSDAQLLPYRKVIAARLDPTPAKIDDAVEAFRSVQTGEPRDRNRLLLTLGLFDKVDEIFQLLDDPRFQPLVEPGILFRPEFSGVRADPRFMAVAARLGLVRYWHGSGNWPDFCTSEQLKYDCKAEAAKYL
jgi:tetratricopeptide (TPR) repeat protein